LIARSFLAAVAAERFFPGNGAACLPAFKRYAPPNPVRGGGGGGGSSVQTRKSSFGGNNVLIVTLRLYAATGTIRAHRELTALAGRLLTARFIRCFPAACNIFQLFRVRRRDVEDNDI